VQKNAKLTLNVNGEEITYSSLRSLTDAGYSDVEKLPYSIRVLLESVLRKYDGHSIQEKHIESLANWDKGDLAGKEVPFKPSRVILQDLICVSSVFALASLRKAMKDRKSVV